jgi:hypothetical protein
MAALSPLTERGNGAVVSGSWATTRAAKGVCTAARGRARCSVRWRAGAARVLAASGEGREERREKGGPGGACLSVREKGRGKGRLAGWASMGQNDR